MKNIIKTTLNSILFCSLLFLSSCEKDLYQDNKKYQNQVKKYLTFSEFKTFPKALNLYNKIKSENDKNTTRAENGLQARLIYNEILGFYINTDKILYTVENDLQTFTFEVYRNTDDLYSVENLVLTFKGNDEFESYLTKYEFTEQEKELIKNGLYVPSMFSKFTLKTLLGKKLIERGQSQRLIYHDPNGNCYYVNTIDLDPNGGYDPETGDPLLLITFSPVAVDCPETITQEGESGGSYTGSDGYYDYSNLYGSYSTSDWTNYSGPGEGGGTGGTPEPNPATNGAPSETPLLNTSPVLTDEFNSGKAYEAAKSIRSIITLSNAQFDYLLHNYEDSIAILNFLTENNNEDGRMFAYQLLYASNVLGVYAGVVWNDYDNFRNQMSNDERTIFDDLPANRKLWYIVSAKKARDKAIELFPNSLHNGIGDAYRHALWNAYCYLTIAGNIGEQLTTAHENKPNEIPGYNFNDKEVEMDLYNNHQGVLIGMTSNLINVSDNVLNAINNGHLRYLNNLADFIDNYGDFHSNLATVLSVLIPTDQ